MGGGSFPFFLSKGDGHTTVFESLIVAISFSTLIVAVLLFPEIKFCPIPIIVSITS